MTQESFEIGLFTADSRYGKMTSRRFIYNNQFQLNTNCHYIYTTTAAWAGIFNPYSLRLTFMVKTITSYKWGG